MAEPLTQEALEKTMTILWSRVDDPLNFAPTMLLVRKDNLRRAQLILEPWRGAERRKYLNKRRKS